MLHTTFVWNNQLILECWLNCFLLLGVSTWKKLMFVAMSCKEITCAILYNDEIFYACVPCQKKDDGSDKDLMKKHRRQVLFSGIVTAIGKLYFQFFYLPLSDCFQILLFFSLTKAICKWIALLAVLPFSIVDILFSSFQFNLKIGPHLGN